MRHRRFVKTITAAAVILLLAGCSTEKAGKTAGTASAPNSEASSEVQMYEIPEAITPADPLRWAVAHGMLTEDTAKALDLSEEVTHRQILDTLWHLDGEDGMEDILQIKELPDNVSESDPSYKMLRWAAYNLMLKEDGTDSLDTSCMRGDALRYIWIDMGSSDPYSDNFPYHTVSYTESSDAKDLAYAAAWAQKTALIEDGYDTEAITTWGDVLTIAANAVENQPIYVRWND